MSEPPLLHIRLCRHAAERPALVVSLVAGTCIA